MEQRKNYGAAKNWSILAPQQLQNRRIAVEAGKEAGSSHNVVYGFLRRLGI